MLDRSSRPHRCPNRTHRRLEKKIKHLRTTKRLGPVQIGGRLGMHPSTVHRVITRLGLPRLALVDQATGEVIRREKPVRYEHARTGDLVHVDIKKLGNIPDGGGWHVHGHEKGRANRQAHRDPARPRKVHGRPNLGYCYLHNAVDDHSRLAYVEIHVDEKAETAAGFWHRAVVWFAAQGIFIDRVLTDNGSLLPLEEVGRSDAQHRVPTQAHPALPAPDQRQGRTVQPHPAPRVGLRPSLRLGTTTPQGLAPLAAHLQPSQGTHRTRRPTTRQPRHQPLRSVHLGVAPMLFIAGHRGGNRRRRRRVDRRCRVAPQGTARGSGVGPSPDDSSTDPQGRWRADADVGATCPED